MGRLAEQLGRRFEAKAFLTVAIASSPDRADIRRDLARLAQASETLAESARTLGERLQAIIPLTTLPATSVSR